MSYGADTDSRWGKSYDSVSARSYDNKEYARWLQADDDQWAEDYDDSQGHDADIYGKGASVWAKQAGYGHGWGAKGEMDAASRAGYGRNDSNQYSDWDAYGRD